MPIILSGNITNSGVGNGEFIIGSNRVDYFEIGKREGVENWLKGETVGVGESEFLFNGRIYLPNKAFGVVIDNFPKGPEPSGWYRRLRADQTGYELVDCAETVLFGYKLVTKNTCLVTVNIYSSSGKLVAESTGDDLRIHLGPVQLGRGGIVING